MLSWLVLFAVLSASKALNQQYVDEFMARIHELAAECVDETKATEDDIAELIGKVIPPTSREAKCMLFCIQRKFKLMKEDGRLHGSGAMNALKPLQKADEELYQKVLKIFIICGTRVKPLADACDTATALAVCFKDEADAVGLSEGLFMID